MTRLPVALCLAGLLTACTQFSANAPSTQANPTGKTITMTMTPQGEEIFEPKTATFKVGEQVTIVNKDNMPHTATAKNGAFDTGPVAGGASKTVTMSKAGMTEVNCTLHPGMGMMVTVE